jgi:ATP-dependent phosphoenolpyruvate carboxykinase
VAPSFHAAPETDATVSHRFLAINLQNRVALLGGCGACSEIKNAVFKLLSYVKPLEHALPLRARAFVHDQAPVLVLGQASVDAPGLKWLGGSGGDEQLWNDEGVSAIGGEEGFPPRQPSQVILAVRDESKVLPPLAQLDADQARYHFVSGFDGRQDFNPCYAGEAILREPFVYGSLLKRKIERYGVKVWLINTALQPDRSLSRILENKTADFETYYEKDPWFGFRVPKGTVTDDSPAKAELVRMYLENFKRMAGRKKADTFPGSPVLRFG